MAAGAGALTRMNDRLVAPGARRGEVLATYIAAMAGAGLAVGLAVRAGLHRPGRDWRHHLGFAVVHVQPFVLALVVPGFAWMAAAIVYGLVVVAAVVVLGAPIELRRPVAFAVTVTVPAPLAGFAPILMVKLVLGHLLAEEASR